MAALPAVAAPRVRSPLVLVAAVGAAVLSIGVAVLAWRSLKADAIQPIVHAPSRAPAPPERTRPTEPPPKPARELTDLDFDQMMMVLRPSLGAADQARAGAADRELMVWATAHLRWADVALPTDEITFLEAAKDVDAAIGKRLCQGGTVLKIERDRDFPGAPFVGVILPGGATALRFVAYGSTGKVVEMSQARFCGIVLGKEPLGVDLVGLFDLPENRIFHVDPTALAAASAKPKGPAPRSAADQRLMKQMMEDRNLSTKVQNPPPLTK